MARGAPYHTAVYRPTGAERRRAAADGQCLVLPKPAYAPALAALTGINFHRIGEEAPSPQKRAATRRAALIVAIVGIGLGAILMLAFLLAR